MEEGWVGGVVWMGRREEEWRKGGWEGGSEERRGGEPS